MDGLCCKCCSRCTGDGVNMTAVVLLAWALTATTLLFAKVIMNPQPKPIKRDVQEKKTQSQCTYTSLRKVENPRFQVLPEENRD